ncbi:methionine ABC transporter ATP-binding protein [Clostridium taeniosporum]|uniref:Methionine ABC transporter ATP-binding protein n=1 Tax=Clostridium taeniosporum TaxID=394958 RepID=A0A1D7XG48_9CLOT|nr:methionine ABC transporter ATP-binding protein [Clostridium taeniosporum]AOR22323.1 methionine ABC transporter ATP-binding protein [Clostridium taeniosporum]
MIEVSNLEKNFEEIRVLSNISISIKEGEIYGIIGHSGAGKSTLLRCINGLESYNNGFLKVMGNDVSNLKGKDLRSFRRNLGMIFQNFNLIQRKNVFDNVAFPLEIWKYNKNHIKSKVMGLLKLVGLEEKINSKPSELSGGQKQRVAIARALALEPKILLCDEATSALDPKTTKDILSLLLKINQELGITIVIVTHQMEVVKEICERVTLLEGGNIKSQGKCEELFLKPKSSLKKFLGEDDENILPQNGANIKIFFSNNFSENAVITKMARELNIDFSIVSGKLEKFRDMILGGIVININECDKDRVIKYLENKKILLEVIK